MTNNPTYENYRDPDFLVWAKTGKALELIWTGNNPIAAIYQVVMARFKYKSVVKLDWV